MAVILAMSGLVMNGYVLTSCYFQRIALLNPLNGEPIKGSERGYGFMSREADFGIQPDYQECIYYPGDEYDELFHDGWMPAGKLFAYFSAALGFVGFCVLLLSCCLAFSNVMFERWLLWGYLVAACSMALTMLIFGSEFCAENQCKIGEGGGYAISNFLFWCVMANTVKSMGEALPNSRGQNQDDDYDYDHGEEVDPDDETGQDMYFETAEAMYAKRPKPAPVYYDDENNNVSDDDDDDDEEDDDEEEVAPYNDDEENYRAQPAARDENYSIDDDDDDGGFETIEHDDNLDGDSPQVGDINGPTIT